MLCHVLQEPVPMPWPLRPEPLEFAHSSPGFFLHEIDLDASPDAVFAVFADIATWPRWTYDMREARWMGEQHEGVGALRHVTLGPTRALERFLAWEPGRRLAFRVEEVNVPLLRAFVEDWRLEPLAGGRTHLIWRVGYETSWLGWLVQPFLRPVFRWQFRQTLLGLQRYLARPI